PDELGNHAEFDEVVRVELREEGLDVLGASGLYVGSESQRVLRDPVLDDLQESLLDSLARHVARDGDVLALARDLVDLIDVHDTALGGPYVSAGVLDELEQDVLDVLADVAGLRKRSGVGHGEGDFELPRERLGEEGLAGPRRPD